ncbi:dipeptidase [Fodinicurvata sediminis]|uniref:dipeptidase n=1 Tax=Fodinicurvata sediminis TaxID=1121832 RepID=UPI0003B6A905|nr:membrane dipeptidase [Fodinicurvata sediminis]
MRGLKIWFVILALMGLATTMLSLEPLIDIYDRQMNKPAPGLEKAIVTPEDAALHQSLFIADLHADTLKWNRDLLARGYAGHVDLPRLREGNVALQVFTMVTMSPLKMPWSDSVSRHSLNMAAVLAAMQGRPAFSSRGRALYQINRFKDAVERSREDEDAPELLYIQSAEDLRQLVQRRRQGEAVIGGILGLEGAHWIGGGNKSDEQVKAEVRELFDAGVRLFAPVHRFDNNLSGSNEGRKRYGLTRHGRVALQEAERLGMMIDLAHISQNGLHEAAELLQQPFVISHTGVKEGCAPPCTLDRNLSDSDIRHVLRNDGVIGVGFWTRAVGDSPWRIADAMEHIMEIAEDMNLPPARNIAYGSDYDGSVLPLIGVEELNSLTAIMRQRRQPFDEEAIRDIAGRNSCRAFLQVLPGGTAGTADTVCATAQGLGPREPRIQTPMSEAPLIGAPLVQGPAS